MHELADKDFTRSRELQARSHRLIPGGAHTYAKGDDQYPVLAPGFIERGRGCHVWDVDGNEYIAYGMGNRCVTLGHAFPAVVEAARAELERGSNFARPSPIEVEAAEEFVRCVRGAEMVKFTKDGSTTTTAALKLARAVTGRDHVAFCADHPFFAIHDWFIGATEIDAGVPRGVKELTHTFRYNDLDSVRALFERHPGQIAALILEPAKYDDPEDGYLHEVRDLCHRHGALFVLDEMITGFRWDVGGAQQTYDIVPDLSAFGKAMGNGYAVSALCGKREIMELGGLTHDRERVFLLSTTHGGETHALAAAIATMRTYRTEPVIETLYRQGEKLRQALEAAAEAEGVSDRFPILGRPCCMVWGARDQEGQPSQAFRTLFLQETIKRGVIMPSLVVSYSHTDEDIERTAEAVRGALAVYRRALDEGVEKYLVGRPSQIVYRKYN
jgi:glutamate-1-semialdehyde 2,1-aminomutase